MRLLLAPLKATGRAAYGLWAWLALTGVTLPMLAVLLVLPGLERRRQVARLGARLTFWLWGMPPDAAGIEHLPAGPCIVVANHASYLDGIILTAVLPPRFAFVIKREMSSVPMAGLLLRRIGSEFVERFDTRRGAADARRIMNRVRQQQSVAFFPEGTFRRQPGLRKFHGGAFVMATRAGLPVVPVVISGSRGALPSDSWLPVPRRLRVRVLPPLPQPGGDNPADALRDAARHAILAHLDEPDGHGDAVVATTATPDSQ